MKIADAYKIATVLTRLLIQCLIKEIQMVSWDCISTKGTAQSMKLEDSMENMKKDFQQKYL